MFSGVVSLTAIGSSHKIFCKIRYRVIHQVWTELLLTFKLKLRFSIQGDHSPCEKPPIVFKTKVLLWPGQVRAGQAKMELLF